MCRYLQLVDRHMWGFLTSVNFCFNRGICCGVGASAMLLVCCMVAYTLQSEAGETNAGLICFLEENNMSEVYRPKNIRQMRAMVLEQINECLNDARFGDMISLTMTEYGFEICHQGSLLGIGTPTFEQLEEMDDA